MEYNGLKWISIRYTGATEAGLLVHPESGITKGVTFLRRTDDDLIATPSEYEFPEDYVKNEEAEQGGGADAEPAV